VVRNPDSENYDRLYSVQEKDGQRIDKSFRWCNESFECLVAMWGWSEFDCQKISSKYYGQRVRCVKDPKTTRAVIGSFEVIGESAQEDPIYEV